MQGGWSCQLLMGTWLVWLQSQLLRWVIPWFLSLVGGGLPATGYTPSTRVLIVAASNACHASYCVLALRACSSCLHCVSGLVLGMATAHMYLQCIVHAHLCMHIFMAAVLHACAAYSVQQQQQEFCGQFMVVSSWLCCVLICSGRQAGLVVRPDVSV